MTDKQKVFAEEYLKDSNATQAAIRAGYSAKTAKVKGSELYNDPEIKVYIRKLQDERSTRTGITADYVLLGLREVAERCLQKVPVMKWDYINKTMVQEQDDEGKDVWTFDSSGANKAFELLGKHVGVFEKDNKQKVQSIKVTRK
jgi:phage terminase small subunit